MSKSPLLASEDYWAIWLGAAFLLLGLLLFMLLPPADLATRHASLEVQLQAEKDKAPFKTVAWYEAFEAQKNIKASSEPIGKWFKQLTATPGAWLNNPLDAFITHAEQVATTQSELEEKYKAAVQQEADRKAIALEKEKQYTSAFAKTEPLEASATQAISDWRKANDQLTKLKKKYNSKPTNAFPGLLGLMAFFILSFGFGASVMGTRFLAFAKAFVGVFVVAVLAYTLGEQQDMNAIGFGYTAWAIILGLLISNTIGTPKWMEAALATEFYIKTGLVLLGAEILLGKIMAIGLPGIFVAWVVTPIVLVTTYWFGQKVLKISSNTLNITISADMSVCGVSAAVATAAACKATKEELTVAIGLSMVFTSVMMMVMPMFIKWVGMPEVLGGAWLGGTLDSTGAVVAAGAFLGDKALSVAATIKMIQNMLIGVIAIGVAVYFARLEEKGNNVTIGWGEIWKRFPKFILGFLGASVLFSTLYALMGDNHAYTLIDQGVIGAFTKHVRDWLFCLAFVSIGLSIHFGTLRKHFVGGKALILYVVGQLFNLGLTLLMAYVMFYLVFPGVTKEI
jgi:uncharacterized integral membrane protein (TIGR00698 family)